MRMCAPLTRTREKGTAMADEQVLCPDCGTPLVDLERRLEVTDADASHRHHAVDCVRVLKERVKTLEGDPSRILDERPTCPTCPTCRHRHLDRTGALGCWACVCGHPSDCGCAGCVEARGRTDGGEVR